jgi:hypothetical protein
MRNIILAAGVVCVFAGVVCVGSITGRVTLDSDGTGVRGVWVYAYDYDGWDFVGEASTDSNGYYSITGLLSGTYRVLADTWDMGTPYISEYYDNVYNSSDATGVIVAEGQDTGGIDFGLREGGTISGRVTRDSDGVGVGGVEVDADDYDTGNYVASGSTDSDGNYSIMGLLSGTYRVRVYPWGTPYIFEYYDNVYDSAGASAVAVTEGEDTGGIDFGLGAPDIGDGYEPDDSSDEASVIVVDGSAQAHSFHYGGDIDWVMFTLTGSVGVTIETGGDDPDGDTVMWLYDGDGTTEIGYDDNGGEGRYSRIVTELGLGTYYVAAARNYWDDRMIRYTLSSREVELYDISGTVRDLHTGVPVGDVRVGCWHEEAELSRGAWTGPQGEYELTDLPPGEVSVWVLPEPDTPYACMGGDVYLTAADVSGVDFALPQGATLSGRLVDAETAEPVNDARIDYSSERYAVWQNVWADMDGYFTLTNLPPGMADLDVEARDDPSYVWLPWFANRIYLEEGEVVGGRIMALTQGALVWGYVKGADGGPVAGANVNVDGEAYDGDAETNDDGYYELYLPAGSYDAKMDFDEDDAAEDQWASIPVGLTVSGLDGIKAPDIVAYSRTTGGQISGQVVNSGGWGMGWPYVKVLEAGTMITPETFATTFGGICGADPSGTGEFVIPCLPPGSYDVYLIVGYEDADEVGSFLIYDRVLNVAAGTSGLVLNASLGQGTLRGIVRNADGEPVLGATVFIADSASGEFAGMAESGPRGEYVVYNMPAGRYALTAMHLKYDDAIAVVDVGVGESWAETMVMPFAGNKEATDLNGDGVTDLGDLAEFSGEWLEAGEGDFDGSGAADLADLARMAEMWQWEAIWTLTGNPPDMIGRWPMDENEASKNVFDHTGNGHHGAADSNTAALAAEGKVGGCFDFSGIDYVRVADHADFTFGNGASDSPFSISAWVYYNGGSGTQTVISKDGLLAGSREWNLLFVSNQLYM